MTRGQLEADLTECVAILAAALGYPHGPPPPPPPRTRRPYRWPADIVQPCGTPAAERRHRRHGDPIDFACRIAAARYRAERKAITAKRGPGGATMTTATTGGAP